MAAVTLGARLWPAQCSAVSGPGQLYRPWLGLSLLVTARDPGPGWRAPALPHCCGESHLADMWAMVYNVRNVEYNIGMESTILEKVLTEESAYQRCHILIKESI